MSCTTVAELFRQSCRRVEYRVRRFEEGGFAGFHDSPSFARPLPLTENHQEVIGADLRRTPFEFGYSQGLWDGKLLTHHLKRRYNVEVGQRQSQRLFHRLRFRLRKPRSLIAKVGPELQAQCKKTGSPIPKR